MDNIDVIFRWKEYRPDSRQYQQQRWLLECGHAVAVKVPLEPKYIHNFEDMNLWAMGQKDVCPEPILTIDGLAYIDKLAEDIFWNKTVEQENINQLDDDNWID